MAAEQTVHVGGVNVTIQADKPYSMAELVAIEQVAEESLPLIGASVVRAICLGVAVIEKARGAYAAN